jgi:hypothetical protein
MSQALPSLVALTLVVAGAVAAVPAVVVERLPRQRPLPSVPGDRWYLNGSPIPRAALAERLGRRSPARQVRFLPSAALPMATVASSLRWLRQRTLGPVSLELPPP